jgi:hypothetical protein
MTKQPAGMTDVLDLARCLWPYIAKLELAYGCRQYGLTFDCRLGRSLFAGFIPRFLNIA